MIGTPSSTSFMARGATMKVAWMSPETKDSFIEGKSLNLRLSKIEPRELWAVTQLVTGQVRCQVTGRKPT